MDWMTYITFLATARGAQSFYLHPSISGAQEAYIFATDVRNRMNRYGVPSIDLPLVQSRVLLYMLGQRLSIEEV